ncbi:MAG: hypothetical protein JO086_02355, partial [Acidimicrobiia bacterium]|nr:hypothetical protein [Acidimicrobiia bacterium]
MTAQLFDLGVRLRAAATGRPQPRVARPLWAPRGALVAAHCARADDGSITVSVARPGGATATSLAPTGLLPLAHDDESSRGAFECLVVADRLQLALLMEAAKATPPGVKADRAAATVAWWVARADHPGTGAVLIATEAARQRLVLADPDAEGSVGAWLRALGRPVPADHVEAPLALVDAVADGAKGVEGVDDQREWRRFCTGYDAGYNWRGPDTAVAAAVGLRAREDASELFARALLDDPAWAQRERFAGRVVVGT